MYKNVCHPIRVPDGEYCWTGLDAICGYFNNEGGWVRCELNLGDPQQTDSYGYLKPPKCLALKVIPND